MSRWSRLRAPELQPVWNIPNTLTFARCFFVPLQVWLLIDGKPLQAFYVYFLAVLSDIADGYVARRFNQRTYFGAMLDPLVDKLTILLMFGTLVGLNIIPVWLAVLVMSRDLLILVGSAIVFFAGRQVAWRAIPVGKVTTFSQNATVLAAIVHHYFAWPVEILHVFAAVTVVLTVVSFVQYTRLWKKVMDSEKQEGGI